MINLDEGVHVVASDPGWTAAFAAEKARLTIALKLDAHRLEHIGSTAVKGIVAKPIIDMMLGIDAYPPSAELLATLTSLGYQALGEAGVPGRSYLRLRGSCSYNLHVVQHAGDHWRSNINLRDYLSQSESARNRYSAAKLEAISSGATQLLAYSAAKESVIRELLKDAAMRSNTSLERTRDR